VPVLVAVPPGVVTAIVPVVAAAGTLVVSLVAETTVKVAELPLKATLVAPIRFAPSIVTVLLTGPLPGLKPDTLGVTVNIAVLVAVPVAVVTLIGPEPALGGTVAAIWVPEFTTKMAFVPLNLTALPLEKLAPVMITETPEMPFAGVNRRMLGSNFTVNTAELTAVLAGMVTAIGPVAAESGTVTAILVEELIVKADDWPLNVTAVAPVKFAPVIVTLVPVDPVTGEKAEIRGATVKALRLVAVPAGVVTEIVPVVAFAGTVAVICVDESTAKVATLPLTLTIVAPDKFAPEIVTGMPTVPVAG
jgi:hypothetical protein